MQNNILISLTPLAGVDTLLYTVPSRFHAFSCAVIFFNSSVASDTITLSFLKSGSAQPVLSTTILSKQTITAREIKLSQGDQIIVNCTNGWCVVTLNGDLFDDV